MLWGKARASQAMRDSRRSFFQGAKLPEADAEEGPPARSGLTFATTVPVPDGEPYIYSELHDWVHATLVDIFPEEDALGEGGHMRIFQLVVGSEHPERLKRILNKVYKTIRKDQGLQLDALVLKQIEAFVDTMYEQQEKLAEAEMRRRREEEWNRMPVKEDEPVFTVFKRLWEEEVSATSVPLLAGRRLQPAPKQRRRSPSPEGPSEAGEEEEEEGEDSLLAMLTSTSLSL